VRDPTANGTADYDAVVVGASLAGLAAAAILSNRGHHVAVVDQLGYPGGKVGGLPFRDYWLDWGHRDGHGIGDLAFIAPHIRAAAEAAGVTVNLRPFTGECIRVHWLHEGRTSELPGELVTAGGDPLERVRALCHAFVGEAETTDATVEAVLDAQTRLGTMDDAEAWRLVTVKMGDWLRQNVGNAAASRVILQTLETIPFTPAEEASVGRYALFMRSAFGETPVVADDPDVGGVQGLIAPWMRVLEERGCDLWFEWKPMEIVTHDGRVTGVVARSMHSLVQLLRAPVVISTRPGWELPDLVEEHVLPRSFVAAARDVRSFGADVLCWWAGLQRLPTRRADGAVEDHSSPWQRILSGAGAAVHRAHGGFMYPSAFSRRSAPPDRHLLCVWLVDDGERAGERGWRRWADAQAAIDTNLEYLRGSYYADLDDCVEWSHYQWCPSPGWLSWYGKPVHRHPVEVPTVDGLYVAASTAEGVGSFVDSECAAALTACDLIAAKG